MGIVMLRRNENNEGLKWYVLLHDPNKNDIYSFNIFDNWRFSEDVEEELKKYTTFEAFKERIERLLTYYFWSKAEYEIAVGGLFDKYPDEFEKIDVYNQVVPNIDILSRYIVEDYNKHKRKKLEL